MSNPNYINSPDYGQLPVPDDEDIAAHVAAAETLLPSAEGPVVDSASCATHGLAANQVVRLEQKHTPWTPNDAA
ncbi:MAG TPA: hypothetical protein VMY99_03650 [Nevskiaceae bacterium]|nr:hypothetical protein [Nevskiaceae bacterium]